MNRMESLMFNNRGGIKKRMPFVASAVLAGILLICMAGCHSSDDTAAIPPSPKPSAQSQADAIQKIKDNPNIPPSAKANILSHMQGTAPPPVETGPAKP
jgi:hypothetical protein